ncbi:MAG: hypothetical protein JST15_06220 [Bacteroidetes bacterium]|nr:hypothetical protein [Bacteroidota bacterium]
MKNVKCLTFIIAIFVFSRIDLTAQSVTTEWVVNNFTGYPAGVMIGLDSNNNVLVTGHSGDHRKIITKKFDSGGNLIWERFYSIPDFAVVATWLSMDNSGNVIVTGYRHTFSSNPVETGLLTLKYDNNGNLLWDRLISGTWAFAVRSIVDQSGNIFVTGRAWQYTGTYDFVTVKYAPDGTQIWFDTFDQNSGFHTPAGMDLDQNGNLFITGGGLSGGLITVMYNSTGTRQWVREKSGTAGSNIKSDGSGGIFVTGSYYDFNTGTSNDIMLLKYDLSGNLIWQKFYDFGNSEYGRLINIDSHSNIFITGFGALQGGSPGWLTMKTDPSGNHLWYKRFKSNLSWEEYPYFALTGPADELYVTGNVGVPTGGTTYNGLETIRYNSDGSNPWVADVNLYGGIGIGLAIRNDLSLYVVGQYYYSVIKYSQSGILNVKLLIEGLYDPLMNKMTKDTVIVYLKNSSSPYGTVDSAKSILDSNGNGNFSFTNAVNSVPYFIVINHRNSAETWSSSANSFTSGNLSYDFTLSSGQAYGNNQILRGAKYCIYSGDVNKDRTIDAGDLAPVDDDAFFSVTGYVNTDVNGDNITDAGDLSIVEKNALSGVSVFTP